jgi:hypothetical protein
MVSLKNRLFRFFLVNETTIAFDLADLYTKTIAKAAFCVDKIRLEQIEKVVVLLRVPPIQQKTAFLPSLLLDLRHSGFSLTII